MSELVRKRRGRAPHRSVVTKKVKEANMIVTSVRSVRDGLDRAKLVGIRSTLEDKLGRLRKFDSEIEELIEDDEELEKEVEESEDLAQEIHTAIAALDKLLQPSRSPSRRISDRDHFEGGVAKEGAESKTKLPTLSLPSFNGDVANWISFRDTFKAAVDDNESISSIEKFTYLKTLLTGRAEEAIRGLALTSTNYAEALAILEKRFGNKQLIINRHMDVLLDLGSVSSVDDVRALRSLYDTVEAQVRGLHGLGVAADSYGTLLSSILFKKLPREFCLILSRVVSENQWELDKLLEAFESELKARERAATATSMTKEPQQRRGKTNSSTISVPTATTLMTDSEEARCCYCLRNNHTSEMCRSVKGAEARKRKLREGGRCFKCLRRGHVASQCRTGFNCSSCGGRHHVSLCLRLKPHQPKYMQSGNPSGTTQPPQSATKSNAQAIAMEQSSSLDPRAPSFPGNRTVSMCSTTGWKVLLQTAEAIVYNPQRKDKRQKVSVILDSGSQYSYITHDLQKTLQLRVLGRKNFSIATFGSTDLQTKTCDMVSLGINTKDGSTRSLIVRSVPLICEHLPDALSMIDIAKWPHLVNLDLAQPMDRISHDRPGLLIGCDHYWDLVTGEIIRGTYGPVAIHTQLGWVLSGPILGGIEDPDSTTGLVTHCLKTNAMSIEETNDQLQKQLKAFWELESIGILSSETTVHETFINDIEWNGDRYEVSLPWKDSELAIPDNYQLCVKRLKGLLKRLQKSPNILKMYDDVIQEQERLGIVEVIPEPDPVQEGSRIHYLPHHAVIRSQKNTTKLRVVYDASARSNGPSLNDCLYVGPKFQQDMVDILFRFRSHKIALIADIEKAFLMVGMAKKDRDVLRFLWPRDIHTTNLTEVRVLRFARVVFGVTCSPFLLNATIRYHLQRYVSTQPQLVRLLTESTYVDDVICGAPDEEEGWQLYSGAKQIMKEGGFNLRKFATNSETLLKRIQTVETQVQGNTEGQDHHSNQISNQFDSKEPLKVLGVRWDVKEDVLVFDLHGMCRSIRSMSITKRNVVSAISGVYDPMGILSPFVVRLKLLLREITAWKPVVDWDDCLPWELQVKWNALAAEIENGPLITIPRYYFHSSCEVIDTRLCGFSDASKQAYAAVVYLLIETNNGNQLELIAAKTRVTPIKPMSIPRLELLATLLLARLITNISEALGEYVKLNTPYCFTDSKVSLYWIQGITHSWKPFVQNRTNEIRRLVPIECWRHCPGRVNPADLPSRGIPMRGLIDNLLWFNGPDWVTRGNIKDITDVPETMELPVEGMDELRHLTPQEDTVGLLTNNSGSLSNIITIENYSSLTRLLCVTAVVLRFIALVKRASDGNLYSQALMYKKAERLWIMEAQSRLHSDKVFKIWKSQFMLFQDQDGVWRCGGRLGNANIPYETKHPIVLPCSHPYTILVMKQAHQRVLHNGTKETLSELRSKYWVPRGRANVRRVIHQCRICRRHEGPAYWLPQPPPLPAFRVQESPPFSVTGVDFAGPLHIKGSTSTQSQKIWIALYTCGVVRAVHLDIVMDLSAQAFIRSFKRFSARRGLPSLMISDNGKTFKGAAKAIDEIMNHRDVSEYLMGLKIEWRFNLERAAWWGGLFERMVGLMKRCLRKVIGQNCLSYDELLTVLAEVEMVINSRPLSYVSTEDLDEPLTPSHLLIGRRILSLPDGLCMVKESDREFEVNHNIVNKRMRHINSLIDHYWKRWQREYLLNLRERHHQVSSKHTPEVRPQIKIGDVVLVHDPSKRRGFWNLGRIEEIISGTDGVIRGAVVTVCNKGKRTTLRRSIAHLYPLEVGYTENSELRSVMSTSTSNNMGLPRLSDSTVRNDLPDSSNHIDLSGSTDRIESSDPITRINPPDSSNRIDSSDSTVHIDPSDSIIHDGTSDSIVRINASDLDSSHDAESEPFPQSVVSRPKRKAAIQARDRILTQSLDNQ